MDHQPSRILIALKTQEIVSLPAGATVLEEGAYSGVLAVLVAGEVEVTRAQVRIDTVAEPGAVFGEISALLGVGHSASVRTLRPSQFHLIRDPRSHLAWNPDFHLHVSVLLARRLNNLVKYLADVKQQYEGHDHLGMVDDVLASLVHRQPRARG